MALSVTAKRKFMKYSPMELEEAILALEDNIEDEVYCSPSAYAKANEELDFLIACLNTLEKEDDNDLPNEPATKVKSKTKSLTKPVKEIRSTDGLSLQDFYEKNKYHYVDTLQIYTLSSVDPYRMFGGSHARSQQAQWLSGDSLANGSTSLVTVQEINPTAGTLAVATPDKHISVFEPMHATKIEDLIRNGTTLRVPLTNEIYILDDTPSTPVCLPLYAIFRGNTRETIMLSHDVSVVYSGTTLRFILYVDCHGQFPYIDFSSKYEVKKLSSFASTLYDLAARNEFKNADVVFYNVQDKVITPDFEEASDGYVFKHSHGTVSYPAWVYVSSHKTPPTLNTLNNIVPHSMEKYVSVIANDLAKYARNQKEKKAKEHALLMAKLMTVAREMGELTFTEQAIRTGALDLIGKRFTAIETAPGVESVQYLGKEIVVTTHDVLWETRRDKKGQIRAPHEVLLGKYEIYFAPSSGIIKFRNLKKVPKVKPHPHIDNYGACIGGYPMMIESAYRAMAYDNIINIVIDMLSTVTEDDLGALSNLKQIIEHGNKPREESALISLFQPTNRSDDDDD